LLCSWVRIRVSNGFSKDERTIVGGGDHFLTSRTAPLLGRTRRRENSVA
jgi:hypothetical protein